MVAERWLVEARVSRDSVRFALPPSKMFLGAGDVVSLPGETGDVLYRIDRVDQSDLQLVEAVRIEPEVYLPSEFPDDTPASSAFVPSVPVQPLFLDLPLITGEEVEHAPYLAVTSDPWPGSVAVYASGSDDDYALNTVVSARSIIGMTETPLQLAPSGRWDNGAPLQVKLTNGAFETRTAESVLNGANLLAIGDGSSGLWELFQFQTADLIASDTYWLSRRLRGQLGSDGLMPLTWPAGSWIVAMNGLPGQIELRSAQRRMARHYRIGPARKGYSDPSYVHLIEAFDGNGLRPYAPCHLRVIPSLSGDMAVEWVRRTRIDGDSWDLQEVPLAEESEHYLVRVRQGATVVREANVVTSNWTYTAQARASDVLSVGATLEVAQMSARYGPGLFTSVDLAV